MEEKPITLPKRSAENTKPAEEWQSSRQDLEIPTAKEVPKAQSSLDHRNGNFSEDTLTETNNADRAVEPQDAEAVDDRPKGFKLVAIIVALCLATFLAALDANIISTAIPVITEQFRSLEDVGWYASAFFLTQASFQAAWGKAFKYFGLKWVYLFAILIFEVGSLICGVAPTSDALIAGRAVLGVGASGILAGGYIIIAFCSPPSKKGAFVGFLGATYGIASVVGPPLGGAFTTQVTWRWCFYINLPIGGVVALLIFLFLRMPRVADPVNASPFEKVLQMDLPGTVIILGAVICYLFAFQWGGTTKPWNSADVIGTLVGFVILAIVFCIVEWRSGSKALLLGRLLKQRTVAVACAFSFFLGGAFFSLIYYLPLWFQAIQATSAEGSGIRNLGLILPVTIFVAVSSGMVGGLGQYIPFMLVGGILTTIGSGMLYTLDIGSPAAHWIGYQVLAGTGIGLCFQVPIIATQAVVTDEDVSQATAMVVFFQTLGGAICVSASQSIFQNYLLKTLARLAPEIPPIAVLAAGATELRTAFQGPALNAVLQSYVKGLHGTFLYCVALAGIATIITPISEWRSIKVTESIAPA